MRTCLVVDDSYTARRGCSARWPSDPVTSAPPRPEEMRHLGEVVRARSGPMLAEGQAYLVEAG